MKKILELWPLVVAAAIAWPLNVSWSVVPNLIGWGILNGFWLFVVAEVLANLELVYWWWFWGWLGRSIQKLRPIKETIAFGKETVVDLKKDNYVCGRYLDPIKNHFLKQYDWLTNPDNFAIKWLKWGGHGMMFFFGIEFFIPGLRIAGTFFCRTAKKWKAGFATLLVGNFFHIAIMIWGWDFFFSWLK